MSPARSATLPTESSLAELAGLARLENPESGWSDGLKLGFGVVQKAAWLGWPGWKILSRARSDGLTLGFGPYRKQTLLPSAFRYLSIQHYCHQQTEYTLYTAITI